MMRKGGGHEGPRRAPEEMINELPRQKWTAEMRDLPIAECAVCKDDFEVDDETITLPCRHLYHDVSPFHYFRHRVRADQL